MAKGVRVDLPLEERVGIYTLHHLTTGHFYIGSSKQIRKRVFFHRNCIMGGYHPNPKLAEHFTSWRDVHVVVTYLESIEEAKTWENKFLAMFIDNAMCCNQSVDGVVQLNGRRGVSSSREETRQKLAVAGLRRCSIEGVEYPSIQAAMEELGINRGMIGARLKSRSPRFKDWKVLEGRSLKRSS